MNSYNRIEKVNYAEQNDKSVVSVIEYIMFIDDRQSKKCIVFKFQNNLDQELKGIKFEITQLNDKGTIIEKSVLECDKLLVKEKETFVPNQKFPVEYETEKISCRLVEASFDRTLFKNDHFEDKTLAFDEYKVEKENKNSPEVKKENKEKAKAQKIEKKNEKKRAKTKFKVVEHVNKNKTKFPYIFSGIFSFLLIVFIFVGGFMIRQNPPYLTSGSYDYVINGEEVSIVAYNGNSKNVVIPEKIGKYKVTTIESQSFKDRKISSVEFKSDITVMSNAFLGCKSLKTITTESKCEFQEFSFAYCTNITTVTAPNSSVFANSFIGNEKMDTFIYGNSYSCSYFGDIFGVDNKKLPDSLSKVETPEYFTRIPTDFYTGVAAAISYYNI